MRILTIAFALFATAAAAQDLPPIQYQPDPDTPLGVMNENAPPETAQYAFLIGDWNVDITWTPPTGGEPVQYEARWHNVWAINGFAIMQEWRGPFATGMEVRQYYADTGRWEGFNLYSGWGHPKEVTAEFVDGQMIVLVPDSNDPTGTFINRETYFNITDDSFEMRSERSYDDGETWVPGAYVMTVARIE